MNSPENERLIKEFSKNIGLNYDFEPNTRLQVKAKMSDKNYYRHTGFPGGIKSVTLQDLIEKKPTQAIELAVKGMLPRTKLGRQMLKKLKVYSGGSHPHAAQNPAKLEL